LGRLVCSCFWFRRLSASLSTPSLLFRDYFWVLVVLLLRPFRLFLSPTSLPLSQLSSPLLFALTHQLLLRPSVCLLDEEQKIKKEEHQPFLPTVTPASRKSHFCALALPLRCAPIVAPSSLETRLPCSLCESISPLLILCRRSDARLL